MATLVVCLTASLLGLGFALPPHIIFVVADDLGWNDVSWHNPRMLTPNLESLATTGVILNQSYVQAVCTPSRAAFLTGCYPFRIGRQNHVLHPLVPSGVPLRYQFLPEKLKKIGYATHIVGKWHLGYCNWSYTPTHRGFDSFFGFYTGSLDYFSHTRSAIERTSSAKWNIPEMPVGLDLRNDSRLSKQYNGVYSTRLFADAAIQVLFSHNPKKPLFLYLAFQAAHSPLQVPKIYEDKYRHIADEKRRKYSGMVTAMDDAIGDIVQVLRDRGFWDNCLIVFTTDNGGQTEAGGSNWPLRGNKGTQWEGGTRAVSFVWGAPLSRKGYTNNKLFHAVDWYPTLLHAAGAKAGRGIDGIDQWEVLKDDGLQARNEIVYNIFDSMPPRGAIRIGDYKLIQGFPGNPSGWTAEEGQGNLSCHLKRSHGPQFRLYHLRDDPLEREDLAAAHPRHVTVLARRLERLRTNAVPAHDPPPNERGDPAYWNGAFTPGWCVALR